MSKFSLNNKVASVVCGLSGIGKTISLSFAQLGIAVVTFDFNLDSAKEMVLCLNEVEFVTLNGN
ncbi:hypothetical protein PW52_14230 [Tamlana sedimentorum]|uniref:3-oxoacyl-ACP reductase n=1 Tax=Neotamlana sedimentorum TaxID=1435349 RepID=A0A0D7W7G8_9FLAO|nr:hypothetical protein [Tamlana sedimentorum]KJD33772.1 hypothetical protein PW52_14230 [Tamlana sedimentorum]